MEHIFGEDDYSDGKHDNIDEKDDIDLECYIDAGEADYDKLFNSDWCPLLGRMPVANNMDDSSCENLSVGIIYNARKLWGIKPMRQYTPTDNCIESTDDKPKGLHKYSQLRLDAAQAIARTYPKVKNEADIIDYEEDGQPYYSDTPLDVNWKRAIEIVKESITTRLNEQIKDYHVLSILAIAEAWDVLDSILCHNKSEDNRNIASQVRVSTALLGKAKELFLEKEKKQLEQDTENVKNSMWKYFANPENVYNQSNKAETVVEPVSETAKSSEQQEEKISIKKGKLKRGEKPKNIPDPKFIPFVKKSLTYRRSESGGNLKGKKLQEKMQQDIKTRFDEYGEKATFGLGTIRNLISKIDTGKIDIEKK